MKNRIKNFFLDSDEIYKYQNGKKEMGRNLIQTIDKLTIGEKEWHLHFRNMKEK